MANRTKLRRVFVSYTAQDLEVHAQQAGEVARAEGWKCIDHRNWAATGLPSVEECLRKIEECDALLVLCGERYGYVPPIEEGGDGRKSITWLEVEHAWSRGIPVLPFLQNPVEISDVNLKILRQKLSLNVANFFSAAPGSVRPLVAPALNSVDGQLRDSRLGLARWYRTLSIHGLLLAGGGAWLHVGRYLPSRLYERPLLTLEHWTLRPASLLVLLIIALGAVAWAALEGRGRPQVRYQLFPLNSRGSFGASAIWMIAALSLGVAAWAANLPDPQLERILIAHREGTRLKPTAPILAVSRWRGAVREVEAAALRSYILPLFGARASLSDQNLAHARALAAQLPLVPDVSEPRVRLLVALATLHLLALNQGAGAAIEHFAKVVEPLLPSVGPLWRAEARYAFAAWSEFWAITNRLEDLNREGSPATYTLESLLELFDAARGEAAQAEAETTPYIQCAIEHTRAGVLSSVCGAQRRGACSSTEQALQRAVECYERRSDRHGVHRARYNLALYLIQQGSNPLAAYRHLRQHFEETGNIDSGLHAAALQVLTSVVSQGQGISLDTLEDGIGSMDDRSRRAQAQACLDLLRRTAAGNPTRDAKACRVAWSCFLTDGILANQHFCGIDTVDVSKATPIASSDLDAGVGRYVLTGTIAPDIGSRDLLDGCDGHVSQSQALKIRVSRPVWVEAQLVTDGDSVLLVRGQASYCSDNAPLPSAPYSEDAGLRFLARSDFEILPGTWNGQPLAFELRVQISRAPPP